MVVVVRIANISSSFFLSNITSSTTTSLTKLLLSPKIEPDQSSQLILVSSNTIAWMIVIAVTMVTVIPAAGIGQLNDHVTSCYTHRVGVSVPSMSKSKYFCDDESDCNEDTHTRASIISINNIFAVFTPRRKVCG